PGRIEAVEVLRHGDDLGDCLVRDTASQFLREPRLVLLTREWMPRTALRRRHQRRKLAPATQAHTHPHSRGEFVAHGLNLIVERNGGALFEIIEAAILKTCLAIGNGEARDGPR